MADRQSFELPRQMADMRLDHRGYPIPYFVPWKDGEPFFPAMDPAKLQRCIRHELCWVCGNRLGRYRASVIGPMCAVNRTVSEPQSHVECARFSALHCPFLSNPRMGRVPESKYPDGERKPPAGLHLDRNPGVTCLWIETRASVAYKVGDGLLFSLGEPAALEWYAHGRAATAAEVAASVESGMAALLEACEREPFHRRADARAALARQLRTFHELLERMPV